jgi:hypothetical protein
MPRPKSNKESERLRKLVHTHLQRRTSQLAPIVGVHLDEDMLAAFTGGHLSDLESAPIIKHLVGCSSCRRVTAQLIRLDSELAGEAEPAPVQQEEPHRILGFLSDLASRMLPSTETEVFAYHAPADDFEKKDEAKDNGELESEEKSREQ